MSFLSLVGMEFEGFDGFDRAIITIVLWAAVPTPGLAVAVALPPVNVQGDDSVYTHTVAHTKRAKNSTIDFCNPIEFLIYS